MSELATIFISHTPDVTRALGGALGHAIINSSANHPLVIALNGELGAGKTTFVSGLLHAVGVTGPVRSPTYTLIEPYELTGDTPGQAQGRRMYHLDLYRLADSSELEMLAPRDLLEPGAVLVVEWAERGGRALPIPDLTLTFCYPQSLSTDAALASDRAIKIEPGSSVGRALAASLHPVPNKPALSP